MHALSRTFKSRSIRHQVESRVPFHANRDLRMGIVIEAGRLRDATASKYRNNLYYLTSRTCADPQAGVHMRTGSADRNESAAIKILRRASAITTLVQDRSPSTSAAKTRHPRGGKLWAPRERRQRPDRSGSGKHSRRDGRIVPIAERHLQGTRLPAHLCDNSGRDFAQRY